MIYLIGGPPKCGKTSLAQEFSLKYKISWLATDTLQSVVWAYTGVKERPVKFPSSEMAKKTKRNNDLKYSIYSAREIIGAYRAQARSVYAAVDMVAVCEISDDRDFMLEGYHIEPGLVRKLQKRYGRKNVRAVFLVKQDEELFVEGIEKSKVNNDWILGRTKKKETYLKIAKMVSSYSGMVEREARKLKFEVFDMDKDFAGQIKRAIKYLKN